MVEMYTMTRYLDPEGLASRGLEHFDAWAATFGEVVESMEIAPDGKSLSPRSRFAKFVNLPELQQMFRSFADVQTAEMLNLPRPSLEGGKPLVVATAMSEEQSDIQQTLVDRYERLRSQKVDPRIDNALNITTDGRKLALDARMLSPDAPDCPGSKLNALADIVADIWHKTSSKRRKLTERGIPREQIASIGDADSDAKKQALFEKVRQGTIRVLVGSTQKMGTGTNVQKRLVALHHVDAPWKPAEVEQREGRILRQGNENEQVAIYRYVTEGSFDAFMWQALETKAKFINQVMTGENAARRAEDIASEALSYAEVKAIASGNPAVLTLAEADAEIKRLSVLKRSHADEQYIARKKTKELPGRIEQLSKRLRGLQADLLTASKDDRICVRGHCTYEEALARLSNDLNRIPEHHTSRQRYALGTLHGLDFGIEKSAFGADVYLQGEAFRTDQLSRESQGPRAVMNALHRLRDSFDKQIESMSRDLALAESQLRDYHARIGAVFRHEDYLNELTQLRDHLKVELSKTDAANDSIAIADQITSLKAEHTEEPIAARIRTERESPRTGHGVPAARRS
jgi:hypothetical protein